MIRTTVLFLLLLAAVQCSEDAASNNSTACEAAKESIERTFQVLSISTRELGKKCREEKRDCDKKMRESAQLEDKLDTCESKVNELETEVTNYVNSIREMGSELFKCNKVGEDEGSGSTEEPINEEVQQLKFELENAKNETENLNFELEKEKKEKESFEKQLAEEKEDKERIKEELETTKEEAAKLMIQLGEEKRVVEDKDIDLEEEKILREIVEKELLAENQEKEKLQQQLLDHLANYSSLQTELENAMKNVERFEKENRDMVSKLQICNELRLAIPEVTNEVENKNASEKCSRIGRDLDLVRTNSGIYYFNYNTALPWLSAKDYCRSRGLEMATAETEDAILEVGRVRSRGYHVAFWTAASDRGHSPGQFHWPNGRKVATDLWFPGQPDQAISGREDCAYVFGSRLKDSPCSDSFYFACQVPQECVPHLR